EDLQPLLAESLEAVRTGARLERPAAQDVRPGRLHLTGDVVEQVGAFDGAWPGDHAQRAAADTHASADLHNAIFLVELATGQLERLEDRQHLFHAGNGGERLGLELVLIADDADDGAVFAAADVWLEAQLRDALEDVVDLFAGGVGAENDDHLSSP